MDRSRSKEVKRLRGRKLMSIREQWFAKHPLCAHCLLKTPVVVSLATQLDHIVPLYKGGKDFDKDNGTNRQGLCDACHEAKTEIDMGYKKKIKIGVDGFPEGE